MKMQSCKTHNLVESRIFEAIVLKSQNFISFQPNFQCQLHNIQTKNESGDSSQVQSMVLNFVACGLSMHHFGCNLQYSPFLLTCAS
jgi:hypothetical protein